MKGKCEFGLSQVYTCRQVAQNSQLKQVSPQHSGGLSKKCFVVRL